MAPFRIAFLLMAAALVSACSSPQTASRNVTADQGISQSSNVFAMPNAKITDITVTVPRSLTVSEKNSYFPRADIVWRGDLIGDRHEQVESIVKQAALNLAGKLDGTRPVHMNIEVTRFHGLTEKARYSTGGVHNMNFVITLTDPATGTILRGPRTVVSNLDALRGTEAIEADRRGETQKFRVTAFLEHVLRQELTTQAGYVDTNQGFFVALNRTK